jgi:hypothetical protein
MATITILSTIQALEQLPRNYQNQDIPHDFQLSKMKDYINNLSPEKQEEMTQAFKMYATRNNMTLEAYLSFIHGNNRKIIPHLCKFNDEHAIRYLLKSLRNDEDFLTVMNAAATYGQIEIIKYIHNMRPEIELKWLIRDTLGDCIENGFIEIVEFYLENADSETFDNMMECPRTDLNEEMKKLYEEFEKK